MFFGLGYYERRLRACLEPGHYVSLIIDGADQAAYGCPYYHENSHLTSNKNKVKLKLMAAIVHGYGAYCWTSTENLKQGHNVTIQALHEVLRSRAVQGHGIPDTIYLQLDNTTKQCKGRFLTGFCAYLILRRVTKRIVISMLPVGHTHEDID